MLLSTQKLLLVALLLLSTGVCFSQKTTTLSGNIKGLDAGSKVKLYSRSTSKWGDSCIAICDSFKFNLNINQGDIYFLTYYVKSKRVDWPVYMQNGLDIHLNSIENTNRLIFSGSDLSNEQNDFYKQLSVINKPWTDLANKLAITEDSITIDRLNIEKKALVNKGEEFYESWLKNHSSSPFSVTVICLYMQDGNVKAADLEKFYNDLSPLAKENNLVAINMPLFFARMKENEMLKQGELIKDFVLNDTTGTSHSFNSLKGDNYVLLDLWASWCGPCRKSTPEISKLLVTYNKCNFKVISISADTDSALWKEAIVQDNMNWPQLSDLKGSGAGFLKDNRIFAFPTYLLVSPQGILISKPWSIEGVKEQLANIFSKDK